MKEYEFKEGDRVDWWYYHCIGGNRFRRCKTGIFIKKINRFQAKIRVFGNMNPSKVPMNELYPESK